MSLNPVPAAMPSTTPTCDCGCFTRRRRYPSDLTDAQWATLQPLLPAPAATAGRGGRPERHHRRAMIDAILYLVDNGIRWRAMPADFPPWRTVYGLFARWAATFDTTTGSTTTGSTTTGSGSSSSLATIRIADRLRRQLRTTLGRNPTPTAGIIDSQSVKESADAVVPTATSGYDAHKHVNGRKRHILVDTCGLLCAVIATPANDRDAHTAPGLLAEATRLGITRIWADQGYHVNALTNLANTTYNIHLIIVRRPYRSKGFTLLTRRWVVERTFAWLTRRRRCARDYERLPGHHETMIWWAAILTMTRRLTRLQQQNNQ